MAPRRKTSAKLEKWKGIVSAVLESDGSIPKAYQLLKDRNEFVKYKHLVKLCTEGEPPNFPPILDLWRNSVHRATKQVGAEIQANIEDTLKLVQAYKVALAGKIRQLVDRPDDVSPYVGSELLSMYKVEEAMLKNVRGQQPAEQQANEMSLDEAKKLRDESTRALARPAATTDSKEDHGLARVIQIRGGRPIGGERE